MTTSHKNSNLKRSLAQFQGDSSLSRRFEVSPPGASAIALELMGQESPSPARRARVRGQACDACYVDNRTCRLLPGQALTNAGKCQLCTETGRQCTFSRLAHRPVGSPKGFSSRPRTSRTSIPVSFSSADSDVDFENQSDTDLFTFPTSLSPNGSSFLQSDPSLHTKPSPDQASPSSIDTRLRPTLSHTNAADSSKAATQASKASKRTKACDLCHADHQPCRLVDEDGVADSQCVRCRDKDLPCTYKRTQSKRGPQKGYTTSWNLSLAYLLGNVPGAEQALRDAIRDPTMARILTGQDSAQSEALLTSLKRSAVVADLNSALENVGSLPPIVKGEPIASPGRPTVDNDQAKHSRNSLVNEWNQQVGQAPFNPGEYPYGSFDPYLPPQLQPSINQVQVPEQAPTGGMFMMPPLPSNAGSSTFEEDLMMGDSLAWKGRPTEALLADFGSNIPSGEGGNYIPPALDDLGSAFGFVDNASANAFFVPTGTDPGTGNVSAYDILSRDLGLP